MFNSKLDTVAEEASNSSNVSKGTLLKGDIESFGSIRVEGKLVGNVKSKSKVALGKASRVEGNIVSQNAEIEGEVKGRIEISDLLILKTSAVVEGDIVTNKLIVETGAAFNGTCKMGSVATEIKLSENGESESFSGKQVKAFSKAN